MCANTRAKSVARMKGCSNQLCLALFTERWSFSGIVLPVASWGVAYSSAAQVTTLHGRHRAKNKMAKECMRQVLLRTGNWILFLV